MALRKPIQRQEIADNLWKSKDWKNTRDLLAKAKARGISKKIEKVKF